MESKINSNVYPWLDNLSRWKFWIGSYLWILVYLSFDRRIKIIFYILIIVVYIIYIIYRLVLRGFVIFPCFLYYFVFGELLLLEVSTLSTIAESLSIQSLEFNGNVLYSLFMERHILLSLFVTFWISIPTSVLIILSSNYFLCRCWYSFICVLLCDWLFLRW